MNTNKLNWFGHDTQGNTRMLLDETGGYIRGSFDYDPYGSAEVSNGYADTPLKFGGQYQDTETGLLYLRARYQDPSTNQFLTVDPLVGITRRAYGYADDDGVNHQQFQMLTVAS